MQKLCRRILRGYNWLWPEVCISDVPYIDDERISLVAGRGQLFHQVGVGGQLAECHMG